MKKIFYVSFLAVAMLVLSGCDIFNKKESSEGTANQNKACPNCVYNYYDLTKYMWQDENIVGNKIVEHTNDYKELKDENGNQRDIFIGYVINDEEIIQRIFACIIVKDELICLEQSSDGSKYEENKKLLQNKFDDCEIDYTNGEKMICDNDYIAVYASGNVGVRNEKEYCLIGKEDGYCKNL